MASLDSEVFDREPALREIVHRLVDAYSPLRIYLFGSKALGSSGPDSDYDILIVVRDDAPIRQRRSQLAYERLWGTGVASDVLVCTDSYFRSHQNVSASIPASVVKEGKLLYAA